MIGKRCRHFTANSVKCASLDPACGCGNFLVIAYREVRRLEMDILQARFGNEPAEADIRAESRLNVGQFYGIEILEWPVRIAEVAMWLMDHQMNAELFARFGQVKATTPLTRSPHIVHENALRIDWNTVVPAHQCTHILGNPPFVGKHLMNPQQEADVQIVAGAVPSAGVLDYVCAWYFKAADYSPGREIPIAFVSTNSITQGEQVGVLWSESLPSRGQRFISHRTFAWMSEAQGHAHVHVVIIGWGLFDKGSKTIFDYDENPDNPAVLRAVNISPYLVEGSDVVIMSAVATFIECSRLHMEASQQMAVT